MTKTYEQFNREAELRTFDALMARPATDKFANFILKRDYGMGDEVYGNDAGETLAHEVTLSEEERNEIY